MTLKDCYMQMGADYEETVQRLRSESLIQRIILKFPQDPSYQELCQALADGNIEVAFRAAHTLKGVCQNLGFKNLYEPSAELTERLRPLQETETDDLMQKVTEEYNRTVRISRTLKLKEENKETLIYEMRNTDRCLLFYGILYKMRVDGKKET